MIRTLAVCLGLFAGLTLSARAQEPIPAVPVPDATATPTPETPKEENPMVILKTSKGDITIELFEKEAPVTVANFLKYVDSGFYKGTIFHRVIDGFMIQGGGFTRDMNQKSTRAPIKNEAANGLKNARGTLAMARTQDPNSATAQFFINLISNDFLDFRSPDPRGIGYCVFAKVVSGMDVVEKIRNTPTGAAGPFPSDVPKTPVIINSATIQK